MTMDTTLEFICKQCGAVTTTSREGWITAVSIGPIRNELIDLCSAACAVLAFGGQAAAAPVRVLHDPDELEDRGDLRPWTSRAAWAGEMLDWRAA